MMWKTVTIKLNFGNLEWDCLQKRNIVDLQDIQWLLCGSSDKSSQWFVRFLLLPSRHCWLQQLMQQFLFRKYVMGCGASITLSSHTKLSHSEYVRAILCCQTQINRRSASATKTPKLWLSSCTSYGPFCLIRVLCCGSNLDQLDFKR